MKNEDIEVFHKYNSDIKRICKGHDHYGSMNRIITDGIEIHICISSSELLYDVGTSLCYEDTNHVEQIDLKTDDLYDILAHSIYIKNGQVRKFPNSYVNRISYDGNEVIDSIIAILAKYDYNVAFTQSTIRPIPLALSVC